MPPKDKTVQLLNFMKKNAVNFSNLRENKLNKNFKAIFAIHSFSKYVFNTAKCHALF